MVEKHVILDNHHLIIFILLISNHPSPASCFCQPRMNVSEISQQLRFRQFASNNASLVEMGGEWRGYQWSPWVGFLWASRLYETYRMEMRFGVKCFLDTWSQGIHVFMIICICPSTCRSKHSQMYQCTNEYMYKCECVYIYVSICLTVYKQQGTCISVNIYVSMGKCVCICSQTDQE